MTNEHFNRILDARYRPHLTREGDVSAECVRQFRARMAYSAAPSLPPESCVTAAPAVEAPKQASGVPNAAAQPTPVTSAHGDPLSRGAHLSMCIEPGCVGVPVAFGRCAMCDSATSGERA